MRILALCNAQAMAHVTRPLEIARVLGSRGHAVAFAGEGPYLAIAAEAGFEAILLPYIPRETMRLATYSKNAKELYLLYPRADVERYIANERSLYEKWQPDCVLIDNRITAITSAELERIPTVSILNVHISTVRKIPLMSSAGNGVFGQNIHLRAAADYALHIIESYWYHHNVMRHLTALRRDCGLPPKYGFAHEQGGLSLLPDVPEFSPARRLPHSMRFVGPLTWHPNLPASHALDALDMSRPIIYVTIGSVGTSGLLEQLRSPDLRGYQFVVAVGKEMSVPQSIGNLFFERFVDTEKLLPHCRLMVCHGGNGTIYQALAHGVPVVGFANHLEQYYGLKRVTELGLGRGQLAEANGKRALGILARDIRQVCEDTCYGSRAKAFQFVMSNWSGSAERATLSIKEYMDENESNDLMDTRVSGSSHRQAVDMGGNCPS